jgi:hypothetical protein
LNKLLVKDPGQRFGSAREVLEALQNTALPETDAVPEPRPALAG